jgi:hypothetical protein
MNKVLESYGKLESLEKGRKYVACFRMVLKRFWMFARLYVDLSKMCHVLSTYWWCKLAFELPHTDAGMLP